MEDLLAIIILIVVFRVIGVLFLTIFGAEERNDFRRDR